MDDIIDYEAIIDFEAIEKLADSLKEFFYKLGEFIGDLVEKVREIIDAIEKPLNKPKYAFIKSNIKPYKEPYIKVRYRARANI